ncbi:sensor histidine kinase [Sphingobacterium wenxiniae]|uniref:histidine kinase n=1 Tax=Sphingobacterium wenxiniae TaxID=683125 RepID=A0A1I6SUE3_9SPHI|nr:histidine kinase [Sphingobacterium wenxiniae]SFS80541.1 Signal transduction histidine kinase [Sphingobacterium wenxiniae]
MNSFKSSPALFGNGTPCTAPITKMMGIPLLIACCFLLLPTAYGQSDGAAILQDLYSQYQNKQTTAKDFLNHTSRAIDEQFAAGHLFEREELIRMLEPYREIAWSADSLSPFRINYYICLSNNANYANREGESVYYLEKAEKEIEAHYGQPSLMVAGRKCNTYLDKNNYKKVIDTYQEVADYIGKFPTLIREKAVNLNIGLSYINVINPVVEAYAQLRDTAQLSATLKLAEAIHEELAKRVEPQNQNMMTVNFYQHYLYFHQYFTLLGKRKESEQALEKMTEVMQGPERAADAITGHLLPTLYTAKADFFLHYGLNDSAAHYIDKLKADPVHFGNHYYNMHRMEANLLANKGRYQQAYESAMLSAQHIDSIQGVLVNDIDEMLYAHTAAEENKALLVIAERKEHVRNWWIAAIVVLSVSGFLGFYLYNRRKHIKTQQQLTLLNEEANLQVAVLQEVKATIRTEEQQKLAQDLHDNLAATLAATVHHLAYIDEQPLLPPHRESLQLTRTLLDKAYQQTRGKSHLLYEEGVSQQEDRYIEHLYKLINTALPSSRYTSQIAIDKGTLVGTSIDLRINILRMTQEILTNIIKHAQAQKVNVTIYKESNSLYIHTENDGKVFSLDKAANSKTLGLNSLQNRLKGLNGSISIQPGGIGTETIIYIPVSGA